MIFANGDCYITYQQEGSISDSERARIADGFLKGTHEYLKELQTTKHTLTFLYSPVKVMEAHNTIEPCDLVIEEVRAFLGRMEVAA
ncbi:hypothetical protein WN59_07205 [Salinicoccus sediminis]|uniref:Uncharacterized protein n=1 Tax=Salinicoccus sediminis TaxID=1432562 RepID=A0A0M2SIJ4_9STAP|nr:hypothetical protein [Salinicoccus sediminis]KKK34509.1 hypothetical protein WN59_07205 [Salinicoccus sediminis]